MIAQGAPHYSELKLDDIENQDTVITMGNMLYEENLLIVGMSAISLLLSIAYVLIGRKKAGFLFASVTILFMIACLPMLVGTAI